MYLPNLKLDANDLPEKVIVCGDPDRAKLIAADLDDAKLLGQNREYHTYVGHYHGEYIGVVSHGVGSPGAAVCFEQLIQGGVKELIRVGTAGSYQKEIEPGSLVVSTAAVRRDGLSSQIVPEGFPAVADITLTNRLIVQSQEQAIACHSGITLTLDVFYQGAVAFPHKEYQKAGVLAVEMEIASLFTIASLRGVRAAAIVAIDGYADADLAEDYDPHTEQMKKAIEVEKEMALKAITMK